MVSSVEMLIERLRDDQIDAIAYSGPVAGILVDTHHDGSRARHNSAARIESVRNRLLHGAVPMEGTAATVSLEWEIPDGVSIVSVEATTGSYDLRKVDGRTTTIT